MTEPTSEEGLSRLVSHLSASSSSDQKVAAAKKVAELTVGRTDDAIRQRVCNAQAIPPLVGLLGSDTAGEWATRALFHLARSKKLRDVIRDEGGLKPLVGLLSGGPSASTPYALQCLINLVNSNPANRQAISCHERGINHLVRLLGTCSGPGEVTEYALILLDRLLVKTDAWLCILRDAFRKEGGFPVLTLILNASLEVSVTNACVQHAVAALFTLVTNHIDNRVALREAGAVESLVRLLEDADDARLPAVENATAILASIATNSEANKDAVTRAGAIPYLVHLLKGPDVYPAKRNAVVALMVLAHGHASNRNLIREAGAVGLLVPLLRRGPEEIITEKAIWALGNLSQGNDYNQFAIREADGIRELVTLLEAGDEKPVVKAAASALMHLVVDSPPNREELIVVGGLNPLIKLAVNEACEASRHAVRALKAISSNGDNYHAWINEALLKAKGQWPPPALLSPSLGTGRHGTGIQRPHRIMSAIGGLRSSLTRKLGIGHNPAVDTGRGRPASSCGARTLIGGGRGVNAGAQSVPDLTVVAGCTADVKGSMSNPPEFRKAVPVVESFGMGDVPIRQYAAIRATQPSKGLRSSASLPSGAPPPLSASSSNPTLWELPQPDPQLKVYCNSGGQLVKCGPSPLSPAVYVGGEARLLTVTRVGTLLGLVNQLGIYTRGKPSLRYMLPGEEVMVIIQADSDVRGMFEEFELWKRNQKSARRAGNAKLQLYVCEMEPPAASLCASKSRAANAAGFFTAPSPTPGGGMAPAELSLSGGLGSSDFLSLSNSGSFIGCARVPASLETTSPRSEHERVRRESRDDASAAAHSHTSLTSPPLPPKSRRGHSRSNSGDEWFKRGGEGGSSISGGLSPRMVSPRMADLTGDRGICRPRQCSRSPSKASSSGNRVTFKPVLSKNLSFEVPNQRSTSPTMSELYSSAESLYSNCSDGGRAGSEVGEEERGRRASGAAKSYARAAAAEAEAEAAAAALRQQTMLMLIPPEDLEGLQRIGAGGYGEVHRGTWRGAGGGQKMEVAIKTIWPKLFIEQEGANIMSRQLCMANVADFCRETQLISSLQHPNVVRVFGVVQGQRSPAIVTECLERSLRHTLDRQPRALDRSKRVKLALDAALGMEYLHSRRIVHFDLKSSNLLISMRPHSRSPILKVCDFGLAKHKRTTGAAHTGAHSEVATLPWTAPEVVRNPEYVTEKVDVFSFAIVMWELWTSLTPHQGVDTTSLVGGLLFNSLRPPVPTLEEEKSHPAPHRFWAALMQRCWAEEPTERPSFSHVASHLRAMCQDPNYLGKFNS